jgi:hypothetical protein
MPPHLRLVRPPKVLHIAFTLETIRSMHRGLIFDPEHVFDDTMLTAKRNFEDFFQPGRCFRLCLLETDIQPGDVARCMAKRFDVAVTPQGEYTVIANVEVSPKSLCSLWVDLANHPERWQMFPHESRAHA